MSLNKASKSGARTYRERHQPHDRSHLGLLEKKKDYKLRADDYNAKKDVLKHLRKKALNKNPDEFHFHMINSKTVDGGVHRDLVSSKKTAKDGGDQIRLLQTQDHKYVSMRRLMERRQIEKLQSALHMLDSDDDPNRPVNTHTIFVENGDAKKVNLSRHFDTTPQMLSRATHRPKLDRLKTMTSDDNLEHVSKISAKSYKRLNQRIAREKQLAVVEEKMKVRRELSHSKNKPAALVKEESNDNAPLIRWQVERKR